MINIVNILMQVSNIDNGDTAWILAATAAVLIMSPGLALFYSGLLRRKSVLSMIALVLGAMFISGLTWVIAGYSVSFGADVGGLFGFSGNLIGLSGIWESDMTVGTLPLTVFVIFQLCFLMITAGIVASPFAERAKFNSFLIFMLIWTIVVYDPIAHWVWGGGWLGADGIGAIDFAGGTVVHINAGFSALAIALVIGKRIDYQKYPHKPYDITMVIAGLGLLWFGWLGFNGGSALAANGFAGLAMFNTTIAACTGALIWIILENSDKEKGKPSLVGMATGVLAGLVGVTPSAANVEPWAAAVIGIITSFFVYKALSWRSKSKIDETLDAFACHGVGGVVGSLLAGVFSTINATSIITGDWGQFGVQVIGVVVTALYSFFITLVIAVVVDKTIGLRVSETEEYVGVDQTQHGETL